MTTNAQAALHAATVYHTNKKSTVIELGADAAWMLQWLNDHDAPSPADRRIAAAEAEHGVEQMRIGRPELERLRAAIPDRPNKDQLSDWEVVELAADHIERFKGWLDSLSEVRDILRGLASKGPHVDRLEEWHGRAHRVLAKVDS